MKDYYNILGVSPNATSGQIKAAYRRLAVQFHPDKNPDPQAEEIFKEINEAYDVLSDPHEKAQYDWKLNPFNTIVSEMEEEAAKPKHRDPAYHKRGKPPVSNPKSKEALTRKYLPYFGWAVWVGLILGVVFWVDLILPYSSKTEVISDVHLVPGRSKVSSGYQLIVTNTGKRIKNYRAAYIEAEIGERCQYHQTIFLKTVMKFQHNDRTVILGDPYTAMAIFPTALLIIALYGIWFRNDAEKHLNVSIICVILLPISLYLIW